MPSVHVYHRQHNCLGMCLGTPNSNTRSELKIHLHARYFAIVLDLRVPVTFPSNLDTGFTPRCSRQVSQIVRLNRGSAWWIFQRFLLKPRLLPLSAQLLHPGHQQV